MDQPTSPQSVPMPPPLSGLSQTPTSQTSPPSPQQGLRFLAPLVIITASGPVSMQMILPALPAIGQHFHVGAGVTHLLVSVGLIAFGAAMLIWGPLSDRFGRRVPLIIGIIMFVAGSLLCVVAPTIPIILVGRALASAGSSAGTVLTRAMVRDVYPPRYVASAMSQLTMGQMVPPMLAPALGGILTEQFGWHSNFIFIGGVGILALIVTLTRKETHFHRSGGGSIVVGILSSFAHLLRLRKFCAYAVFGGAVIAGYFAFLAGGPDAAIGLMGMSPSTYGLTYIGLSIAFMVGNYGSARLSPSLGIDSMVHLGGTITMLGSLACLAAFFMIEGAQQSLIVLFAAGGLVALGNGLSLNNSQAGAMAADPQRAGAAAGIAGFLQMLAAAVTTQSSGMLHDGTMMPLLATMCIATVLAMVVFVLLRWKQV